jgi:hypothetical protein
VREKRGGQGRQRKSMPALLTLPVVAARDHTLGEQRRRNDDDGKKDQSEMLLTKSTASVAVEQFSRYLEMTGVRRRLFNHV